MVRPRKRLQLAYPDRRARSWTLPAALATLLAVLIDKFGIPEAAITLAVSIATALLK